MPVPLAPTALALLPVLLPIVAAVRARARRNRPGPDVYEPGNLLGPAEADEIEAGFEPVYLPDGAGPDKARVATALQAEADAAEARLAARSRALDEQLRQVDPLLGTAGVPNPQRAPLRVLAPTSLRKESTA